MLSEEYEALNEEGKLRQILHASNKMFMRYGIKSVTMDDIARELGMSKKTLYVYFKDKNDIIQKTLQFSMEDHQCNLTNVYAKNLNAIDENFEVFKIVTEDLKEITPTVFYDLKKYYPEAWKIYEEYEMKHIPQMVEQNLMKGIKEGLYRPDINTRIISLAYTNLIRTIFETDFYTTKEFAFLDIYHHIFQYHIHGIASIKGLEYLNQKMKNITS